MKNENDTNLRKPLFERNELQSLMKDFNVNLLLKKKAYRNKPLGFEEAYALGVFALYNYSEYLQKIFDFDKNITEKQSIAALCSFHNKETYRQVGAGAQIAGICAAIFDYDIGHSKNKFLNPKTDYVMDNCGMGGDLFKTPNVSSIAAIIASADGITFCKHGSPGNTDSVGSSDFLEYLGVNLFANKEIVEQGVEKYNFGYTDALDTKYKLIHVQSHLSAHLAHMNDIIGPITNPVNPDLVKKRIIGVNHLIEPKTVAEAYNILNAKGLTNVEHGLFVRGFADKNRNGGMDEISLLPGGTIVAELNKGEICSYELFADDFRLPEASYEDIKPRGDKKEFSKQILYGKIKGHPKNLILANTAIIEYLAHGLTLKQGVERANEVLESGKAVQNIEQYITHVGDLR